VVINPSGLSAERRPSPPQAEAAASPVSASGVAVAFGLSSTAQVRDRVFADWAEEPIDAVIDDGTVVSRKFKRVAFHA
jgi:hypothetical protein